MGKPAARISDFHMCPMVTPGLPPIPHVGGPILPPGVPTVLIGGLPAATMGSMCTCTGPPDSIILGSTGVLIGGKPAARMGDSCAHGGMVMLGCMTVLIGEAAGGGGGGKTLMPPNVMLKVAKDMPKTEALKTTQTATLKAAAETGAALAHDSSTCNVCKSGGKH